MLATDEGGDVRTPSRIRAGVRQKESAVIMVVGLGVGLWAFDSAGADARAFVTFGLIVAFACLSAWYVRFPGD